MRRGSGGNAGGGLIADSCRLTPGRQGCRAAVVYPPRLGRTLALPGIRADVRYSILAGGFSLSRGAEWGLCRALYDSS
jgi:hypothetical protein